MSVSAADVATWATSVTGPISSSGSVSGSVLYTSTSPRPSTPR